ncbi:peptidoglycan -binding protein [Roseomonas gilardii subsp. gilardii]|uniref:peptidoglycan -binding protein n=1 Tax=Roseomonas gilardii TaxID=257708 RepID=UPI001FFB356E|nr:peptidoglycan -binding protein [Roseomonas gilardii]UPG71916.1 peptidoglycan -binding protein [Roseomonas gilardii subsp. gilardii]
MARGIRRSQREGLNAWPGYVDALSTLLMVIIFVLLVFVLAQGFLSVTLSSRDRALDRLNRQVAELADLLSLERTQTDELRASLGRAQDEARRATAARDAAQGELTGLRTERDQLHDERDTLRDARDQLAARLSDAELAARGTNERIASLESRLTEALGRAEAVGGQTAEAVRQRAEAARALSAAQAGRQQAEQALAQAQAQSQAQITSLQAEAAKLSDQVRALTALRDQLEKQAQEAQAKLGEEQRAHGEAVRLSESAQAQAALLNRQIDELKAQLQRLSAALDVQQKAGQEKDDAQIADLGTRLNAALAAKVEELQRYRSDFFGRLREVLGDRPDVRIVGDRFVFQSEVLFPVGSADLSDSGKAQIRQIAGVLKDISTRIPPGTPWILRVDGHADRTPFRGGGRFASNWELSAARAIAVAQLLIGEGLPPNRVAAAAFGDNQPIDPGDSPEALAKNRRIELRLTDR